MMTSWHRCGRLAAAWALFVSLAATSVMTSGAMADRIEFAFEGEIESILGSPAEIWRDVEVGTPFRITYVFEDDATDTADAEIVGVYLDAIQYYDIVVGDSRRRGTEASIGIFAFESDPQIYRADALIDALTEIEVILIDDDAMAFVNDRVPRTLDLGAFESAEFTITGRADDGIGGNYMIGGSLRAVTTVPLKCRGDVNGDGNVDFDDLSRILAAWGPCGTCTSDLLPFAAGGDGMIDFFDLTAVLSDWGPCPGP